jgi:amino acid transporter
VFIGATSAVASLLDLSDLITALVVIQVLVQFMAQVVAVTMIRRYRPDIHRPFQMWLYPLTSIIAFAGWAFILAASGLKFILWGLLLIAVGVAAYLWRAKAEAQWPFAPHESSAAL